MSDSGDLDRLVRRARQSRRWETATFPQAGGGTLHYPAPSNRGGRPTTAGGGEIIVGEPPIGARLRVSGTDVDIGPGGELLPFDTVVRNVLWIDNPIAPSIEWTHPWSAIYGLELWAAYEFPFAGAFGGGGEWELLVDGVVKDGWPNAIISQDRGQRFWPDHIEYDAPAGSRGALRLNHGSDAEETISWVVNLTTKEPLPQRVLDCNEIVASLDPKGWWKLDETSGSTAVDSSGNGFDLSIGTSVVVGQDSFCCGDGAFDFPGADAQSFVGSDTTAFNFNGLAAMSAVVWVEPDGIIGQMVGTLWDDINHGGWALSMDQVPSPDRWSFVRRSGASRTELEFGPTPTVDEQKMVAVTYDGTTMRGYVDGQFQDSVASAVSIGSPGDPSGKFTIGAARTSTLNGSRINGRGCDCQVYDYRLTDAQILDLFNATTG